MLRALGVLSVISYGLAATTDDYCRVCRDHTMCTTPEIGPNCGSQVYYSGVTAQDRETIKHVHNTYRDNVARGLETRGNPGPQPSAANMKKLEWDSELATVAQRWANQCTFQHDQCRNVQRYSWVGQNIAITTWSAPCSNVPTQANWAGAIKGFYDEVALFDRAIVNRFRSVPGVGHYTQLVWAATAVIGCGFSVYQQNNQCKLLYVCNYGPGGNVLDQPVYKVGSPRSDCSSSPLNQTYPGLC